ncbi:MAG: hypothetical protein WCB75_13340 [Pseudolabrys sp.]
MSASALWVTRRFSARARALDRGPLVVLGFTGGNGLLDILEGQMQLIRKRFSDPTVPMACFSLD